MLVDELVEGVAIEGAVPPEQVGDWCRVAAILPDASDLNLAGDRDEETGRGVRPAPLTDLAQPVAGLVPVVTAAEQDVGLVAEVVWADAHDHEMGPESL